MLHACDLFRCGDKRKRKQSESRMKRNCPNSTKLRNNVSSHAKQIWRKHWTLTRLRVNRQLMSENLRLGEIEIKPKQRERKIKEELVRCTQYLIPSSLTL